MSNVTTFEQRHRPSCFDDLIFADPTIEDALRQYALRQRYGCILLYGAFGTAKSTTAEIIIRERHKCLGVTQSYTERFSAVTLKDSSMTVLENALSLMITVNGHDPEPYVIIDEVDLLSNTKQAELRHLIDSKQAAKFIMTTNDYSKVDKGIRSRSDKLFLSPPTAQHMLKRAEAIVKAEGVSIQQTIISQLLRNTDDVREMLRELESLVLATRASSPPPPPPSTVPNLTVLNGGNPSPS